jgi:undecaprenyl-diphosphatase
MSFLHAILLGIVEGITEFLPISSTGHLILASKLLAVPQTEFVKSFEIAIQLGAILSVVVLYWRRLFVEWEVMKRIAVAFVPTAVIGLALYKVIKTYLFSDTVVVWALFVGGAAIIIFERCHREKEGAVADIAQLSYKRAALIGVAQSLAVVPGVSRAAATILGGLLLGMRRSAVVEFSFLLAVPTMAAATGLDLLKTSASFSAGEYGVLAAGFVVSFFVAIVAIRWLLRYIQTHDFTAFGWYRIAVAVAFFLLVL